MPRSLAWAQSGTAAAAAAAPVIISCGTSISFISKRSAYGHGWVWEALVGFGQMCSLPASLSACPARGPCI